MSNIPYKRTFVNAEKGRYCKSRAEKQNFTAKSFSHYFDKFRIYKSHVVQAFGLAVSERHMAKIGGGSIMQNDIFSLLMMILMLENGGGEESINQLVIMFLLMNSRNNDNEFSSRHSRRCHDCGRDDGFTF